jgi:hypothetical protein
MLERLVDWLIFSRPEGPYIYRLDSLIHSRIHIYIRLHIRLHWYEPLSWYKLCIRSTNCLQASKRTRDCRLTMQVHMQQLQCLSLSSDILWLSQLFQLQGYYKLLFSYWAHLQYFTTIRIILSLSSISPFPFASPFHHTKSLDKKPIHASYRSEAGSLRGAGKHSSDASWRKSLLHILGILYLLCY